MTRCSKLARAKANDAATSACLSFAFPRAARASPPRDRARDADRVWQTRGRVKARAETAARHELDLRVDVTKPRAKPREIADVQPYEHLAVPDFRSPAGSDEPPARLRPWNRGKLLPTSVAPHNASAH